MIVHAVVLAGGQGSRLGQVRKADLRLGGKTMLDRVARQLPTHLVVAVGRDAEVPGYTCVQDDAGPVGGPLAGIAGAVRHLRGEASAEDVLVCVAVDTPFLPTDFADRLVENLAMAPAAYAAWNELFYPTNAAFRLGAILDLPERIREFGSPKRLLRAVGAVCVSWNAADNPFSNLNTLGDLIALSRRVG